MFSSGLCPFNRLFWVLPRPGAGKVGVLPGFSTSRVPRPLILFGKRAVQCWFSFLRWGLGQFSYWLVFADLILANQNIRQQKLPIPFFYHYYRPGQAKAGIKEISTLSRLLWLTFMLTVYLKMSRPIRVMGIWGKSRKFWSWSRASPFLNHSFRRKTFWLSI